MVWSKLTRNRETDFAQFLNYNANQLAATDTRELHVVLSNVKPVKVRTWMVANESWL